MEIKQHHNIQEQKNLNVKTKEIMHKHERKQC